MPRPEGIATAPVVDADIRVRSAGTNAPTRGDCDVFFHAALRAASISRNECPDQRGLRLFLPVLLRLKRLLAGTNAPTRGDCDSITYTILFTVSFSRNECPDQRGLRLLFACTGCLGCSAGTNAPTRGDCDQGINR